MTTIVKYYHASPKRIYDNDILRPTGNFPLGNESKVEKILQQAKPDHCLARNQTIYASRNSDFTAMNHGLKVDDGFVHEIIFEGDVMERDSLWIGELQARYPAQDSTETPSPSKCYEKLSDQVIAEKYWTGEKSTCPNLEYVGVSAKVVGAMSEGAQRITPPNMFDNWLK